MEDVLPLLLVAILARLPVADFAASVFFEAGSLSSELEKMK